jgi:hypothetical protein
VFRPACLQKFAHVHPLLISEARYRLVEVKQLWFRCQRPRQIHRFALSIGQCLDWALRDVDEIERFQQSFAELVIAPAIRSEELPDESLGIVCMRRSAKLHDVEHGQIVKRNDALKRPRHADPQQFSRREAEDLSPVPCGRPGIGLVHSGNAVDEGRLACPVWTDKANDLAGLHLEIHVRDSDHAAKMDR